MPRPTQKALDKMKVTAERKAKRSKIKQPPTRQRLREIERERRLDLLKSVELAIGVLDVHDLDRKRMKAEGIDEISLALLDTPVQEPPRVGEGCFAALPRGRALPGGAAMMYEGPSEPEKPEIRSLRVMLEAMLAQEKLDRQRGFRVVAIILAVHFALFFMLVCEVMGW